LGAEDAPPGISADFDQQEIQPGDSCAVWVRADGDTCTARNVTLSLRTTHPAEDRVPLAITVAPHGALTAVPSAVRLGVLSAQDLAAKKVIPVILRGDALAELTLKGIDAPPFLKLIESKTDPVNAPLTFRFAIAPPFPATAFDGTIRIRFEV